MERERERRPDGGASNPDGSGGNLTDRRQQTQRAIQAGRDAIRRAMSTDSRQVLQHSRQESGQ